MIADHPSRTAGFIAQSLIFCARDPDLGHLVPPRSRALALAGLQVQGTDARRWWRICGIPWFRRVIASLERSLLPGIVLHYVLRKHAITRMVGSELAAGGRLLVVVGCGFDALSWRMRRDHPHLRVREIDHPATLARRARACAATRDWPEQRACDLGSDDLASALEPHERSIVVLEGLLMYLDPFVVRTVLRNIATTIAPGSLIVFTAMLVDPCPSIRFPAAHPLVDRWLARQGESFRWGISRDELPAFLDQVGLDLDSIEEAADLARAVLPPWSRRRGATGEAVVAARTRW